MSGATFFASANRQELYERMRQANPRRTRNSLPFEPVVLNPERAPPTRQLSWRAPLADAGKPDVPGLYITRAPEYFWSTVPYLARDQRRIEDVDSKGPDHAADAARYACLRHGGMQRVRLGGM